MQKDTIGYKCIAVVGSGGKTSSIRTQAKQHTAIGKKVIITTTTKMWHPPCRLAATAAEAAEILKESSLAWAGINIDGLGKFGSLPNEEMNMLTDVADIVLVEADGSKGLPLKMTRADEPVIPEKADFITIMLGLDCLGKPLSKCCHRYDLLPETYIKQLAFEQDTGMTEENYGPDAADNIIVTPRIAADILKMAYLDKLGKLGMPHVIMLNIVNDVPPADQIEELKSYLKWHVCVVVRLNKISGMLEVPGKMFESAVIDPFDPANYRFKGTSADSNAFCIVMASGRSRRFDGNKLYSEFNGKTLIDNALSAIPEECFRDVLVVSGDERILALAMYKRFTPVYNYDPDRGISESIRLGIEEVREKEMLPEEKAIYPAGALFLVGDQPLLKKDTIKLIMNAAKENPGKIIVPVAMKPKKFSGQLAMENPEAGEKVTGNPCFFPVEFFKELSELEGDKGGKRVIKDHPEAVFETDVPYNELTDVDRKADLVRIQKYN